MRVKTMMRTLFAFLLLALLAACGGGASGGGGGESGGGGDEGGEAAGTVTVVGQVTGSGGLSQVTVSAGGRGTFTDNDGYYQLTEVPVPVDGRLVITYKKTGYATYQRSLDVSAGNTYTANAKLLRYQSSEPLNGDSGGTVTNPDGSQVEFPPGAFSGDVTVNMAVGDPSTDAGRAVFPGDFMARDTGDSAPTTPLDSVVFTEITLVDGDGNEITQLNEPATVRLRLPASLQDQYSADDTIPWWSYDEDSATWVREDADPSTPEIDDAIVKEDSEGLYVEARVTHFTWWNADHPIDEHACLCVTVTDGDGNPLAGAQVIAEGVTYNGRSTPRATDAQGYACVTVKRSTDAANPERVKLYVEQGGVRFTYDVTDPAEGDPVTDEIFTPTQQGSTIGNNDTSQCSPLQGPIEVVFDGEISGTVTRDGTPWAGFTFFTDYGRAVTTDEAGNYSVPSPSGTSVTLFYPGWFQESVNVPKGGSVVKDIELPNRAPTVRIERNPLGRIGNGATLELTAVVVDPDGDPLTYAWDADAGALTPNGVAAQWQAPDTGTGIATLTFVASDPFGGETTATLEVRYGDLSANTLRLLILDNPFDRRPLVDAPVIVYGDASSQEDSTGEDGWIEFNDVPNPVSFTVGWEMPSDDGLGQGLGPRLQTQSMGVGLRTYVDIPPGEYVIYAEGIPGFLFDGSMAAFTCDTPLYMNVQVNVPAGQGITGVNLLPFDEDYPAAGGLQQIEICPFDLQNDGKVSFLAVAGDSSGKVVAYGFQRDVTPVPGGTVVIDLERQPQPFTWTESSGALPEEIGVMARYKGVYYYGALPDSDPSTTEEGENALPTAFPFETYWFEAGSIEQLFMSSFMGVGELEFLGFVEMPSDEMDIQSRRYTTVPDNVPFTLPDFALDGNYDPNTHQLSVRDTSVGGEADAVSTRLLGLASFSDGSSLTVDWGFLVAGDVAMLDLDQFPPPSTLVDPQSWNDFLDALGQPFDFTASDLAYGFSMTFAWESDAFDGLASYWQYVSQGWGDYPPGAEYFDIGLKLTPLGEMPFLDGGLPF